MAKITEPTRKPCTGGKEKMVGPRRVHCGSRIAQQKTPGNKHGPTHARILPKIVSRPEHSQTSASELSYKYPVCISALPRTGLAPRLALNDAQHSCHNCNNNSRSSILHLVAPRCSLSCAERQWHRASSESGASRDWNRLTSYWKLMRADSGRPLRTNRRENRFGRFGRFGWTASSCPGAPLGALKALSEASEKAFRSLRDAEASDRERSRMPQRAPSEAPQSNWGSRGGPESQKAESNSGGQARALPEAFMCGQCCV